VCSQDRLRAAVWAPGENVVRQVRHGAALLRVIAYPGCGFTTAPAYHARRPVVRQFRAALTMLASRRGAENGLARSSRVSKSAKVVLVATFLVQEAL
jgi:hypothetical protein